MKTICLSLKESRGKPNPRRESFSAQAEKYGIEFDYFDATPKSNYAHIGFVETKNPANGQFHNLGSYAHNLDLATILEQCLAEGQEMLWFMEDDCVLEPGTIEAINKAFEQSLPDRFDLFYIGCQHFHPIIPINQYLAKATLAYQSHCVIIHSRVMPLLIHHARKNEKLFDVILAELVNPFGLSYCLVPSMAFQANGPSQLWGIEMNHRVRETNATFENVVASVQNKEIIDVGVTDNDFAFLSQFLSTKIINKTIETGFGLGFSTVAIMQATGNASHIAIDPYECIYVHGEANVKKHIPDYQTRFTHFKQRSEIALPKLVEIQKEQFDFALIDGGHLFDHAFLDFFYLAQLVKPSGHIAIHDIWMKSIRKLREFILANRSDFEEINMQQSGTGFYLFKKIGEDTRDWYHYSTF